MTEPGARTARDPAPRRRRSLPRVPAHVAVLMGLSAGTYAVFLAGATALEASSESAVAAEKAPIASALAQLSDGHDRLAGSLDEARARYGEASDAYTSLVTAIGAYEARIADLTGRIDSLQAEAGVLPDGVPTPRPAATSAPARQTTSVAAAPLVTPAPKPATVATTGASGKP
jgi:hypothetical protein